jgi:hypothetical protein
MALAQAPSSLVAALLGILTGQIYRSDLSNLKLYRISPPVVTLSTRLLKPLIGSLRPPRRSTRALPDGIRTTTTNNAPSPHNEEVITTARPSSTPPSTATRRNASDSNSGSMVQEWVNELTGRNEGPNSGIRIPSEAEITQTLNMFPDMRRDVVVAALQRR